MKRDPKSSWNSCTILLVLAVLTACGDEDRKAPPAPWVDPVESPTSLSKVIVTGSAEYGATVTISGGVKPVEVVSDAFTAKFRAEVEIKTDAKAGETSVDTKLSVTATDRAGNVSEPTEVSVTYELPRGESIALQAPSVLDADAGGLPLRAQIHNDQAEVGLQGITVRFSASGPGGASATAEGMTDAEGWAEAKLTDVAVEGEWTVTAEALLDGEVTASASARVVVFEGRPSEVALTLSAMVGGKLVDGNDISVPADTEVTAEVSFTDAAGNSANGAGYDILTDAPGALVVGNQILNLQTAGDWTVAAVARDTSTGGQRVAAVASLTVTAGEAVSVEITASDTLVEAGEAVELTVVTVDAHGNAVAKAQAKITSDPKATPGVSKDGKRFTAEEAGLYTLTAEVADPALTDTVEITVVPAAPATLAFMAPATLTAGDALDYTYEVDDRFGNRIDLPVVVSINDPAALVVDDGLSGAGQAVNLVRAGSFRLTARVPGTALLEERNLDVLPDDAFSIDLSLAASRATAGQAVAYTVEVRDAFGNLRDDAATLTAAPMPMVGQGFTPRDNSGGTFMVETLDTPTGTTYVLTAAVGLIDDSESLQIDPAVPVTLSFLPVAPQMVTAGVNAPYTYALEDEFGNNPQVPVTVAANAPGAYVLNDGLSGTATVGNLTVAGSYKVTALVPGFPLSETRDLTVVPAQAARISFELTTHFIGATAGNPATVSGRAQVFDAFGNAVTDMAPVLNLMPTAGTTGDGSSFTLLPGSTVWTASFDVSEAGSYLVRATYDPAGLNLSATDTLQVVSADTDVPTVRITHVNGILLDPGVDCTPTECTLSGDPGFSRNQRISITVEAYDDTNLAEVAYKMSGSGTSAGDFAFVGAGSTCTVATPCTFTFLAQISNTAVPGYARVVAQATDVFGNTANSLPVRLRIDLGIDVNADGADRSTVTVGGGFVVDNPWDVAVDSAGNAYGAYRGSGGVAGDEVVIRFAQSPDMSQAPYAQWAEFGGDLPEFLAFDSADNLYVSTDNADVRLVDPAQVVSTFLPAGDAYQGLSVLDLATPKTGRCVFVGTPLDDDTITIGTITFELDNDSSCTPSGTHVCVNVVALTRAATIPALATAVNGNGAVGVSGFHESDAGCDLDNGASNNECLALVHRTVGAAAASVTVTSPAVGRIVCNNVVEADYAGFGGTNRRAYDPDAVFVGERSNDFVLSFDTAGVPLSDYQFASGSMRGALGVRTGRVGEPERLWVFGADDGGTLETFDTATNIRQSLGNFNAPWDLAYVPPEARLAGCILVSDRNNEVAAIDLEKQPFPTVDLLVTGLNSVRGIAFDPGPTAAQSDDALYIADSGFDIIVRVTRSSATTDCF